MIGKIKGMQHGGVYFFIIYRVNRIAPHFCVMHIAIQQKNGSLPNRQVKTSQNAK